jgi:hypothetical protein
MVFISKDALKDRIERWRRVELGLLLLRLLINLLAYLLSFLRCLFSGDTYG